MSANCFTFKLKTNKQDEFIEITHLINDCIKKSDIMTGIAVVFSPHTTSAITVNENADNDVANDLITHFDRIFPKDEDYKHYEGNSFAHLKSSTIGASETFIINNGMLVLGTWQGVFFCEFDGPRQRKFYVKIIEG